VKLVVGWLKGDRFIFRLREINLSSFRFSPSRYAPAPVTEQQSLLDHASAGSGAPPRKLILALADQTLQHSS